LEAPALLMMMLVNLMSVKKLLAKERILSLIHFFIDSYEKSLLKSIEGAQLTDYSSLLESRLIKYCEKEKPVRDTDQEILSSPFIVITREDGAVVTFKKHNSMAL
jgi:hypothetical protein